MTSKGKNQKKNILDSAKSIALEEGLNYIDIRGVAKKSGISIGTVYNYFPSKAELLVSVIEDFWKEAFSFMKDMDKDETDLFKNLEYIYSNLLNQTKKFKENWLSQISLMRSQEKAKGREREEEYFLIIEREIEKFLDKDERTKNYQWTSDFTKKDFSNFIFENMFIALNNEEEDISYLLGIIEKIIM